MNVRTAPFIPLSAVALAALLPRAIPAGPGGTAAESGDIAWMRTSTGLVPQRNSAPRLPRLPREATFDADHGGPAALLEHVA